jgi:hypothetical protein
MWQTSTAWKTSQFCGMSLMPTYLTDRLLLSTTLLGLSDFFILDWLQLLTYRKWSPQTSPPVWTKYPSYSRIVIKCVYKLTWRYCLSSQVVQTHMRLDGTISGSDTGVTHWTWTSAVWLVAWKLVLRVYGCLKTISRAVDARKSASNVISNGLLYCWQECSRRTQKSVLVYHLRYTLCARVSCNVFWLTENANSTGLNHGQ